MNKGTPAAPQPWDTYHTACRRGRIRYDPESGRSRPWLTFSNGTACHSFGSFEAACHHLKVYHRFSRVRVPK